MVCGIEGMFMCGYRWIYMFVNKLGIKFDGLLMFGWEFIMVKYWD